MNEDLFIVILVYGIPFVLIFFGFFVGGWSERRHLRRLDQRERELSHVTVSNLKTVPNATEAEASGMVMGQVVIATDYFKSIATAMRNLIGGEMKSAHSLMTRGRREALVRLQEEADRRGCTEVHNVRFGFSNISQMRGKHGAMQVEVLVWGTAVRRPS